MADDAQQRSSISVNTDADADGDADAFVSKWQGVTASELSTSQSFLIELSQLLGVDAPHATAEQDYMFERPITFAHSDGSTSACLDRPTRDIRWRRSRHCNAVIGQTSALAQRHRPADACRRQQLCRHPYPRQNDYPLNNSGYSSAK